MTQSYDPSKELRSFARLESEAPPPMDELVGRLSRDLVPSRSRLAAVYAAGCTVGYLTSLALCAQNSVGLSPLAWHTAKAVHAWPEPWCSLICGAMFGVAPFLAAMLFLTRFQHRYLLKHMSVFVIALPLLGSLLMSLLGVSRDLDWHLRWLVASVGTTYGLEFLTALLLKQRRWRA